MFNDDAIGINITIDYYLVIISLLLFSLEVLVSV